MPLLAPVLTVVLITMMINVLKVFESCRPRARIDSTERERDRVGDVADRVRRCQYFGTGSPIAVFLFLLVIPVLFLNIRRFKREI